MSTSLQVILLGGAIPGAAVVYVLWTYCPVLRRLRRRYRR
jgi:hypothetical protein